MDMQDQTMPRRKLPIAAGYVQRFKAPKSLLGSGELALVALARYT